MLEHHTKSSKDFLEYNFGINDNFLLTEREVYTERYHTVILYRKIKDHIFVEKYQTIILYREISDRIFVQRNARPYFCAEKWYSIFAERNIWSDISINR